MSTSDRELVKPSTPGRVRTRSIKQSLRRTTDLKTDVGGGREPVRQSPPRKLNAN